MINLISPSEKYRRKRENEGEKRRKAEGHARRHMSTAAHRRSEARRMASEDIPF